MQFLTRLLGALLAILALVAAFFLLWVVLAGLLVAALLLWAWVRWRTRHLPRSGGPGQTGSGPGGPGEVIEGEYRIEREIRIGRVVRTGDDPPP